MNMLRRGSKKGGSRDEAVDALFASYADAAAEGSEPAIGPEGVERLCADLGVEPTDWRVLALAWKMGAARMGFFTQAEFRHGCHSLGADSCEKLRKALPLLEQELGAYPAAHRDFHCFAFRYCCTEPRQKTLDLETASTMLRLLHEGKPHVAEFCEFVTEGQAEYSRLTLDQWEGFLRFSEEVGEDCAGYDESQAWPLLMDNFVEWLQAKRGDA